MELISSDVVDAFVKAFESYRDPGDSFRSCVRHALTQVAPQIIERSRAIAFNNEPDRASAE